jgi:predicted aconitase
MSSLKDLKIKLTQDEIEILNGSQGPTKQKIMETVVLYGEALGAERLVDIEGDGHFVIPFVLPGTAPSMEMLAELMAAGLKTKFPFTMDPKAPLDFENLSLKQDQEKILLEMYKDQAQYDEGMVALGLRDEDAYTCNPYLPEVGNTPQRGTILAWSESACAVFANSVLAARTNRNGAIMDLLSNIVGKTPLVGLLTDEGRKATWRVEVKTSSLPYPALLGAVIGRQVMADVPFIVGLDRFLGSGLNQVRTDYLHEMGAACATFGAVGLYHVENITPEAVDYGQDLLAPEHHLYVVDDRTIQDEQDSYRVLWADKEAKPTKCFIGCPHLSLGQMNWWANKISDALKAKNQRHLAVQTIICAAPDTLEKFRADHKAAHEGLQHAGVKFSVTCAMTLFDNDLSADEAIITNSNKLRAYTTARFFPDDELSDILVAGEIKGGY